MKLLEIFSGTKSVGKVVEILGYEVISLDLKNADINCDILNWDYTVYEPNTFDVIWASPPCTEYSKAKTVGVRKLEHANKIVNRTIEIINYLKPRYYIIENPQTGLLKNQSFMDSLPYVDIDYCKYGMPYRKRTRLWNNVFQWLPKPLCKKDCGSMNGNKHIGSCGNGRLIYTDKPYTLQDKYQIPTYLIHDIFKSM